MVELDCVGVRLGGPVLLTDFGRYMHMQLLGVPVENVLVPPYLTVYFTAHIPLG